MPRAAKHFKIHCSIQNHRATLGLFDDDALLAMYVRAGVLAVERFADRTGDSFLLSSVDLQRVAGCSGVANAVRKLRRLESATPLRLERLTASGRSAVGETGRSEAGAGPDGGRTEAGARPDVCQGGAGWRLSFPNFARKQGFGSRNGGSNGALMGDTPTATPTPAPIQESPPSEAQLPPSVGTATILVEDAPGHARDAESYVLGGPDARQVREVLHLTPEADPAEHAIHYDLPLDELKAAFASYGKRIRVWSERRKKRLRQLRRIGFTNADLVNAVHGYAWRHRNGGDENFDPNMYRTPDSIFRESNFAVNLEAALEAAESGREPPFGPDPVQGQTGRVLQDLEESPNQDGPEDSWT